MLQLNVTGSFSKQVVEEEEMMMLLVSLLLHRQRFLQGPCSSSHCVAADFASPPQSGVDLLTSPAVQRQLRLHLLILQQQLPASLALCLQPPAQTNVSEGSQTWAEPQLCWPLTQPRPFVTSQRWWWLPECESPPPACVLTCVAGPSPFTAATTPINRLQPCVS